MRKVLLIVLMGIAQWTFAQGLFESSSTESESSEKLAFELNGYIRGTYFVGESIQHSGLATQSAFGESALKLKVDKGDYGEAFVELRFGSGYAFEEEFNEFNIREAYVKYYAGNFDFSIGKQIVVWGRADGYNPTNMLSLQNTIARSPNEDDKRFGNWMLSSAFNKGIFKFEAIWVPVYESWLLPFGLIEQKLGVPFDKAAYPDFRLEKSSFALRANINASKVDGSISYFTGYSPKPGVNGSLTATGPIFNPTAYHINMFGTDFQTTIGKYGMRGEFAYTITTEDESIPYVPNNDLQYVVGVDRSWGNFTALLQYSGRYVFDFKELQTPTDPAMMFNYGLAKRNRIFNGQINEFTHTVIGRLSQKFLHETLEANILGTYNFSTEEIMLRPKITYSITDAMELTAGMEIFSGPEETLFGLIGDLVSAGFIELKISF
jgi:hypothetical protein